MKPMLAAATDGTNLRYPLLASPKLDGVRCLIIDGVAMSRSLKPIPNKFTQRLFGRPEFNGLDGELIVGADSGAGVFQRTSSGVMSVEGQPEVTYYVFDTFLGDQRFAERLKLVKKRIEGFHNLELVQHIVIKDMLALGEHEEELLEDGYEGVMLRDPRGGYKHGRSTLKEGWLIKLKRFVDSEAEITGFACLMHNANEATTNELGQQERSSKKGGKVEMATLGSITCRDLKTNVEFEIGTGFTADQRRLLWLGRAKLKGRLVKYKYQPVGVKDKPRFPVFIDFRDPRDL
jgi:DNA ligase-1